MKNNILLLLIALSVIGLFNCSEDNITGPENNTLNQLEGKWGCSFSNQSPFTISSDTLLSTLQFRQDTFSVVINKLSDSTFIQQYEGTYSIIKDTLEFFVAADLLFTDKYIYAVNNDSLKIAVADTVSSGPLIFVRVSSFLWHYTHNKIGGTFIRLNE